MDVSIVIPIYNSAPLIRNSVEKLIRTLGAMSVRYEILLRDDGSRDHSREILQELPAQYAQVRVFFNDKNRGLGFTLRQLFVDAQGACVIYIDCDLPFGTEVVRKVLDHLEKYDIVVCSRYLGKRNNVLWSRKIASRMYYCLCTLLFHISVRDIGSGTVGFRQLVVKHLKLESDGFSIHAEIFLRSQRNRYLIHEIGVTSSEGAQSSFKILKHGLGILRETLHLKSL